jgi:hypothetical protein
MSQLEGMRLWYLMLYALELQMSESPSDSINARAARNKENALTAFSQTLTAYTTLWGKYINMILRDIPGSRRLFLNYCVHFCNDVDRCQGEGPSYLLAEEILVLFLASLILEIRICILFGYPVPGILRVVTTQAGNYEFLLVGDSYIHTLMNCGARFLYSYLDELWGYSWI